MFGVAVHDLDVPTGTVVHSEFGTFAKMEQKCYGGVSPNTTFGGCARSVDSLDFPSPDGRYAIYYADHKCVPYHEACHSIYEQSGHTVAYNLRSMQGDWLAACP